LEDTLIEALAGRAILALEDGRVFNGRAAGARTRRGGEVVFNTSITGYQEVFTDPSYAGQIVCLTYPHIGNVGANADDEESLKPYIEALVVREFSALASNWRSQESAHQYLERCGVPVIWDIDTRALVLHLRQMGALRGVLSTDDAPAEQLIAEARALPTMAGQELASHVTAAEKYAWARGSVDLARPLARSAGAVAGLSPASAKGNGHAAPPALSSASSVGRSFSSDKTPATAERALTREAAPYRVLAYDFGIKQNILRLLVDHGCQVTVVPAKTAAEEVLSLKPDGVFLSNGPGDPEPMTYAIDNIKRLVGRVPVFGICLGHQLCGLALGGKTFKLKFGHHGSNHPVKNLLTGRVEITAQNHGFCVDPDSLPTTDLEVTHLNLNDHTNEGLRHRSLPLFSVQYHPEASPGPHDARYLFDDFIKMMKENPR
jgi:carbamoyl-phosphate synthase small subunit